MATLRLRGVDTATGQEKSGDSADVFVIDALAGTNSNTVTITTTAIRGLEIIKTSNATTAMAVENTGGGTSALSGFFAINSDSESFTCGVTSSTYNASTDFKQNSAVLTSGGGLTGGIWINSSGLNTPIDFATDATLQWRVQGNTDGGHLVGGSDNTHDIGRSATFRPRTLYLGTSLNVGNGITASTDNGDIVAGDGTRTFSYDASAGSVRTEGITFSAAPGMVIDGSSTSTSLATDFSTLAMVNSSATADNYNRLEFVTANGGSSSAVIGVHRDHTNLAAIGDIVLATANGGALAARWRFRAEGHILAETDNVYDVGAGGATRPRSGYFGTSLNVGDGITASTDNGDIIAGDGTRELDWDASANSLSLTPAAGAATSTLNLGITSTYGALTIVSNGANSGAPDVTFSGTDGSNGTATTQMRFNAGDQSGSGSGGGFFFTAGDTGSGGSAAGGIFLTTGDNTSNAAFNPGVIQMFGPNATVGRGAQFVITAGNGSSDGGPISITTGNGTAAAGGGLTLTTGTGTSAGSINLRTSGATLRWQIFGDTGALIGDLEGGTATIQGRDATTAATAGANLSLLGGDGNTTGTGGNVNLAGGASASGTPGVVTVDDLPLPSVLATITGVDLTATGDSSLYVVPTGRSAIVNSIIVQPTSVTGAAGDAAISVGTNASTFDDIVANTVLTGLDATTETFTFEVGGISHTGAAAEDIRFQVDTADSTASAFDVTVYLVGFLI